MSMQQELVKEASSYIEERIKEKPEIGLILGSGLGDLAEEIAEATVIPYDEIPHFPQSTVEGHAGRLVSRAAIREKGCSHAGTLSLL